VNFASVGGGVILSVVQYRGEEAEEGSEDEGEEEAREEAEEEGDLQLQAGKAEERK